MVGDAFAEPMYYYDVESRYVHGLGSWTAQVPKSLRYHCLFRPPLRLCARTYDDSPI